MDDETTPCYCIIRHPDDARVLVLRQKGGWSLPRTDVVVGWFPYAVGTIARRIREQLGIEVTVLRHLLDAKTQLCELETHGAGWATTHARWLDARELGGVRLVPAGYRRHLAAWFEEQAAGCLPPQRPPWERPGWHAEAVRWIADQAARQGLRLTGPVEQFKAVWSWSAILRAPTTGGTLYFKAVYDRPPPEAKLVAALAERWPRHVPDLVAHDAERGWMLMRDFGEAWLGGAPMSAWEEAMRCFARLQIEWSGHVERWLTLGCEDRRLPRFTVRIDQLLADAPALQPNREWRLKNAELAQARALGPRLKEMCAELGAYRLPDSLVQQDFREGNLVRAGGSFVFFDWSDTVVAHPFFSGNRILDYRGRPYRARLAGPSGVPGSLEYLPERHKRILVDAYLEPWTAFETPARLRAAFALSRRLNTIWQAVRWYLEVPHVEAASMWGRDLVTFAPQILRGALKERGSAQPEAAQAG